MLRLTLYSITLLLIGSMVFNLQLIDLTNIQMEQIEAMNRRMNALEKRDNEIVVVTNHVAKVLGVGLEDVSGRRE